MFMTKMGMGLLGVAGKSLLSKGAGAAAGSMVGKAALSRCGAVRGKGGSGKRGNASKDNPVEELLSALLNKAEPRKELPRAEAAALEEGSPVSGALSEKAAGADRERAALMLSESVCSFIDGRIRLRHPLLKKEAFASALRAALASAPDIESVEPNTKTGSALIRYNADRLAREQLFEELLSAFSRILQGGHA